MAPFIICIIAFYHQVISSFDTFEVVYLDNIVGPCSPWVLVLVLDYWKFFPGLLTYVSTYGCQQFLIRGHFILRPAACCLWLFENLPALNKGQGFQKRKRFKIVAWLSAIFDLRSFYFEASCQLPVIVWEFVCTEQRTGIPKMKKIQNFQVMFFNIT